MASRKLCALRVALSIDTNRAACSARRDLIKISYMDAFKY